MPLPHGEKGSRIRIVQHEPDVLGFAAVVIGIAYGCRDAELSVQSVLYEGRSGMSESRRVVDDVLVCSRYRDWG